MRKLPSYKTPDGQTCPDCGHLCTIIAYDNSFSYSGTHCTHGQGGIHYPDGYGDPVSDCCDAYIEGAEVEEHDDFWDYGD